MTPDTPLDTDPATCSHCRGSMEGSDASRTMPTIVQKPVCSSCWEKFEAEARGIVRSRIPPASPPPSGAVDAKRLAQEIDEALRSATHPTPYVEAIEGAIYAHLLAAPSGNAQGVEELVRALAGAFAIHHVRTMTREQAFEIAERTARAYFAARKP